MLRNNLVSDRLLSERLEQTGRLAFPQRRMISVLLEQIVRN